VTKLMPALSGFGALKQKTLKPDQMVPVSTRAWKAEGSRHVHRTGTSRSPSTNCCAA